MTLAPAPDLFSPEFMQDPYPTYAWLRGEDPVHWSQAYEHFLLTRYDDCVTVLMHPEQFGSPNTHPSRSVADHVIYRNLIARAFDADFVTAQESFIQQVVDEYINQFADLGEVDLMPALAHPLPTRLLAHILGIAESEYDMFRAWAQDYTDSMNGDLDEERTQQYRQTVQDLVGFFAYLSQVRRQHPGSDLISRLIAAEVDCRRLSGLEILGLCEQLMVAGHDLTTGLIGNCMRALLLHPAQLRRLQQNPSRLDAAIEETLRWDSPVLAQPRKIEFECELRGKQLPAGANLLVAFAAANRDPEMFPEPDTFNIDRQNAGRHLAFGRGIHFCMGAPLARLEAKIAIGTLLRRLPRLHLLNDRPPARRVAAFMLNLRTFQSLPIAFGPDQA